MLCLVLCQKRCISLYLPRIVQISLCKVRLERSTIETNGLPYSLRLCRPVFQSYVVFNVAPNLGPMEPGAYNSGAGGEVAGIVCQSALSMRINGFQRGKQVP